MPYNIILYFRLPYFHVSNCALFSTWYFSTLILYRRSFDTFSYMMNMDVKTTVCDMCIVIPMVILFTDWQQTNMPQISISWHSIHGPQKTWRDKMIMHPHPLPQLPSHPLKKKTICVTIIIIKSEVSTFPIVVILFVFYYIFIPVSTGLCFHYWCAVCGVCK